MSFTTYATWIAGSVLTAAQLNQQLRDNGLVLKTSIANDGTLFGPLKGYRETMQTVAIVSNTVTVDPLNGTHINVALNANITSFVVTGGIPAACVLPLVFYFTNDGTPRSITWSLSGFGTLLFPLASPPPAMTGTNGKVDEILILGRYNIGWEAKILGMNI